MRYEVFQSRRFARTYKRLHLDQAKVVDLEVVRLSEEPNLGEKKRGDLAELYVHKFKIRSEMFLLGYTKDDVVRLIYLEALGPHENFYRDLKR